MFTKYQIVFDRHEQYGKNRVIRRNLTTNGAHHQMELPLGAAKEAGLAQPAEGIWAHVYPLLNILIRPPDCPFSLNLVSMGLRLVGEF